MTVALSLASRRRRVAPRPAGARGRVGQHLFCGYVVGVGDMHTMNSISCTIIAQPEGAVRTWTRYTCTTVGGLLGGGEGEGEVDDSFVRSISVEYYYSVHGSSA